MTNEKSGKFRSKGTEENKMDERVINIRRVSKKTTGGNYVSFSALVVVGDGKGKVGVGVGRGLEVPPAIQKAISQAKRRMVTIPIYKDTLPHEIILKYKSSRLLLKPAPPGTGLKVGGVVRSVLDVAGLNNASGKIIGTRNQITNAYAVMEALKKLKPRKILLKESVSIDANKVAEVKINKKEVPMVDENRKNVDISTNVVEKKPKTKSVLKKDAKVKKAK
jgi:small subunit ribosomal protein S5